MNMKKISVLLTMVAVLLAVSCKEKDEELRLQYYTSENTYDIVSVASPALDAEVRNVIIMIGD